MTFPINSLFFQLFSFCCRGDPLQHFILGSQISFLPLLIRNPELIWKIMLTIKKFSWTKTDNAWISVPSDFVRGGVGRKGKGVAHIYFLCFPITIGQNLVYPLICYNSVKHISRSIAATILSHKTRINTRFRDQITNYLQHHIPVDIMPNTCIWSKR